MRLLAAVIGVLLLLIPASAASPWLSEKSEELPASADAKDPWPSERPSDTPMVDGPVRAIARSGENVWVGGDFGRVERRGGELVDEATSLAVFDAPTGRYKDVAPALGGEDAEVWDMAAYGDDLAVAGSFDGPGAAQKNLVLVDGTTGAVTRWFGAPPLRSVLAAPGLERVYGGGLGLSAFDAGAGETLWTRARASVDLGLRPRANGPGYRDLELDGSTIWAACICDSVDGAPAKALVKLDTGGGHDTSWVAEAEPESFGLSLAEADGALYLGAGGEDFLARYSKTDGGRVWSRDTSGSTQAVETMDDTLVVGGHFWEVADGPVDACGHRPAEDEAALDPRDQCQTRHGLAIYSRDGTLLPGWHPAVEGRYNLVWALRPGESGLDVGGEFTSVDGVGQTFYARLPR